VRVAALFDVHGNLPALEAVLAEVEREDVDVIVSGGDVVWGPRPAECLRLLREAGATFVGGNCERQLVERKDEVDIWCSERLTDEERAFVAGLPLTERVGDALFCHATPRSDSEIVTRVSPEQRVREAFGGVEARLVVCGHTHQQYDRYADGVRIVNAGSIGLAYEGDVGAYWALLGEDVKLWRTSFDVEKAAADAEASGFPALDVIVSALRDPPDRDEVAAHFEAQAGA
jgi:putative phosphoesterase